MVTRKSVSTAFKDLATTSKSTMIKVQRLQQSATAWKPHNYQRKALKFILERRSAALLLDPGLGKTSISYAALKVLKNNGLLRGALVVAPKRPALSTWPKERDKWKEFAGLDVVVLHGKDKDKLVQEKHDIYVINYEGLKWLIDSGHMRDLFKKGWLCTLIMDELSKLKHTASGRHKLLAKWHGRFERRWGLTGSPASNGLLDLFGQIFMLDLGKTFGPYVTYFRSNFFTPANPNSDYPTWVPQPGAEDLIYERLKNIAIRIDAEDHVAMPAVIPNVLKFNLPEKIQDFYDTLTEEMFAILDEDKLFTAATAAAASIKCRQVASGALYEDRVDPLTGMPRMGKRLYEEMHSEKLEMLEDLIDEVQGNQMLIVYEFGHDRERILKLLGKDTPCIGGGTSDKKALAYEDAWNAGEIQHMLVHAAAVGHGMNFQASAAHHIAWYTMTWDYELYDQLNRRLRRQGNSAKHLFLHHFMARGTVEEAVYASLNNKRRVQNRLHDALRLYRQRRILVTE